MKTNLSFLFDQCRRRLLWNHTFQVGTYLCFNIEQKRCVKCLFSGIIFNMSVHKNHACRTNNDIIILGSTITIVVKYKNNKILGNLHKTRRVRN